MGVEKLWSVLKPAVDLRSWDSLSGMTLAVDVSGWLCQSAHQTGLNQSRKPHLNTLLYRVSQLHRCQVKLVFVFDGPSPKLKQTKLSKRAQYRGGRQPTNDEPHTSRQIQECKQLLSAMGVPYLDSPGEAEAHCAFLNRTGLVDGVLTEDGDAFLFGAEQVYRNFSSDVNKVERLECYTMQNIKTKLQLTREHLVVYALLAGCDYYSGVKGVGSEKAKALLQIWPNKPLERLRSWKTDKSWKQLETYVGQKRPSHCTQCAHPGSVQKHHDLGCESCEGQCTKKSTNSCQCTWHTNQSMLIKNKTEMKIRSSALHDPLFPPEEVIDAFLADQGEFKEQKLQWEKPYPVSLMNILSEWLGWKKKNAARKVASLLTSHDMFSAPGDDAMTQRFFKEPIIVRKCMKLKQDMYEVHWMPFTTDEGSDVACIKDLIDWPFSTLEYQSIFSAKYPEADQLLTAELTAKSLTQVKCKKKHIEEEGRKQTSMSDYFPLKKIQKTSVEKEDPSPSE